LKLYKSFFTIIFFFLSFNAFSQEDESIRTFIGHSNRVFSVAISPNGKYIASGSTDLTIKLWDVNSDNCLKTFIGHSGKVESVCFSPDGKYLASGSNDKTIKLWEENSGNCIKTFIGHSDHVNSVAFSPDGKYLASGSTDKTIKIWDLTNGKCLKTFSGHTAYVSTVCFSPNGKSIISGSADSKIKKWDLSSGICLKTLIGHKSVVNNVCFSPDGKTFASSSWDETIKIWDMNSGTCIKTITGLYLDMGIAISPDNKYIASGSINDGKVYIRLLDLKNGTCIKTFSGHTSTVWNVSFSPDGNYLYSASLDSTIKQWDISSYLPLKIKLKNNVEAKIKDWQQKGEFEKTTDYQLRVNEQTRNTKIKELQKQFIYEFGKEEYDREFDLTLGAYDADYESYLIYSNNFGNMLIKVPFEKAQNFKNKWNEVKFSNPDFSFDGEKIQITRLTFNIEEESFVYDNTQEVKFSLLNVSYNFKPIKLEEDDKTSKLKQKTEQKQLSIGLSDIDLSIPQMQNNNPNAIAVIIGNTNYSNTAKVDFALNDAKLMKEYLIKTLGYKEGNILYNEDISLDKFNTLFGTKGNARGRLANLIKQGISEVFIYYVGHGAPGINDSKGYFVPVGCDPNYVEQGGYQLDVFYENLAQLKAKSITVVTDACFSGANIFKDISPIGIRIKDPIAKVANITVFSSSSGTEVSSWYNEKGHGMFTYFFLKAIQDKEHSDKNHDGNLTYQELYDYVSDNNDGVPYYARRIHNVQQNPTLEGDRKDQVFIKY
jgi:hypothetical protein